MGKVYKRQTALTIWLYTKEDISESFARIKYKKPSGALGFWNAEIVDAANGVIKYDISSTDDLDESGLWTFWAEILFFTNTFALGEPATEYIYNEGE